MDPDVDLWGIRILIKTIFFINLHVCACAYPCPQASRSFSSYFSACNIEKLGTGPGNEATCAHMSCNSALLTLSQAHAAVYA